MDFLKNLRSYSALGSGQVLAMWGMVSENSFLKVSSNSFIWNCKSDQAENCITTHFGKL